MIIKRNAAEFKAARTVQGCVRTYLAAKLYLKLREALTLNKASSVIQRAFRGLKCRRKLVEMLNSFHPHTIVASMISSTVTSSSGTQVSPFTKKSPSMSPYYNALHYNALHSIKRHISRDQSKT